IPGTILNCCVVCPRSPLSDSRCWSGCRANRCSVKSPANRCRNGLPRAWPQRFLRPSAAPQWCACTTSQQPATRCWCSTQSKDIPLPKARKYFGTDGVRGRVGELPITPELVMRLGYAAGKVLTAEHELPSGEHAAVLIGKDTRISGYMLESALQAGLSAAGVDIYLSGPMPTPAVAYLTRALRLQAGIVISASHNPFEDNGIKFFSADGNKLPDSVEHAIEARLDAP